MCVLHVAEINVLPTPMLRECSEYVTHILQAVMLCCVVVQVLRVLHVAEIIVLSPPLSQECYKQVSRMLQGCYEGVTRVLQGCDEGATRVLHWQGRFFLNVMLCCVPLFLQIRCFLLLLYQVKVGVLRVRVSECVYTRTRCIHIELHARRRDTHTLPLVCCVL
jgi:hypothetical protein